jgi:chromosome segregation ATPase
MSELKNKLNGKRQELEKLIASLESMSRRFGGMNLDLHISGEKGTEELRLRALAAKEALEKIDSEGRNIRSWLAERESLEKELEELEGQKKESGERRVQLLGEIGRKVFGLFQQDRLEPGKFSTVFSALTESSEKERSLESNIMALEESKEKSPLLRKIPFGAKISIARNSLAGIRKEREQLFRKAGEALFSQNLIDSVEDPLVLPLIAAFRETERGEGELTAAQSVIEKKLEAADARLEAAEAGKSGSKRLREIDQQREQSLLVLEESEKDYGAALLLMPELREQVLKNGDSALLEEIAGLERREEELRIGIAALESGLEAEGKREELEKQQKQLEKLTEKKHEVESDIKALKKAIADNEKEFERLSEAAGTS